MGAWFLWSVPVILACVILGVGAITDDAWIAWLGVATAAVGAALKFVAGPGPRQIGDFRTPSPVTGGLAEAPADWIRPADQKWLDTTQPKVSITPSMIARLAKLLSGPPARLTLAGGGALFLCAAVFMDSGTLAWVGVALAGIAATLFGMSAKPKYE